MALTKVTGQVINDTTGLVVGVTTVGGGLSATDGFFSGITTITSTTESTSSTTGSLIVSGGVGIAKNLSIGGSVSIGGTLTYEDVTNIDSVGLITARAGVVVGSGITLSKDGDIFATGVTTATSFVGDGSQLIGVAATENIRTNTNATFLQNINVSGSTTTGSLVSSGAISGTTGTFSGQVSGTVGAFSGTSTFANAINLTHASAGSNIIYFNEDLQLSKNGTGTRLKIDSSGRLLLGTSTSKSAGSGQYAKLNIEGGTGTTENFVSFSRAEAASAMSAGDEVANLTFNDSAGYEFARIQVIADAATGATDTPGRIVFKTTADGASSSTERLRIDSSGRLLLGTTTEGHASADDLTIATSASTGLTIRSGTSNEGNIYFSDGTSGSGEYAGAISYNHSANSLNFYANSTNRANIDSSGNFQISTGTLNISNDIKSSDDDFYVYSYKGGSDGQVRSGIQYDGNSQRLRFFTGTNERIRITSTGNLEKLTGGSYFAYNSNGYYAKQDNYDTNGGKSYWYDGGSGNNNIVASIDGQTGDISAKGNIKILTAGKGIDFSATGDGSGSMSNELLNDYEEGTWTPSGFCDGGSLNVSGAAYTKIGQVVYIYMYISSMDIPNTACNFKIYGLPYTVTNSNSHFPALAIGYSQSGNLPAEIRFLCRANQTYIYSHTTAGNSDQRTNQHIRAYLQSQSLILTGYYFTDS